MQMCHLLSQQMRIVDRLLRQPQVFDARSPDITLVQLPEFVPILGGAHHVPQVDVHVGIARGEAAVVRGPRLELDEEGEGGRRLEEGEGQLRVMCEERRVREWWERKDIAIII